MTIATFYSHKFEGKRTASGTKFSHKNYTCATTAYKLGDSLKVVNLSNNKSVKVLITDRCLRKNIVDLSKTAFKEIGSLKEGKIKVKIIKI